MITENTSKAQFCNFLLNEKYGLKPVSSPIIQNQIIKLNGPDFLKKFDFDFTLEDLEEYLEEIAVYIKQNNSLYVWTSRDKDDLSMRSATENFDKLELKPTVCSVSCHNNDIADMETSSNDRACIMADLIFAILYCSTTFIRESKKKDFKFPILKEFYKHLSEVNKNILKKFNTKDQGKININRPKHVVTRFPPEANGYLHIGHVKAALLNAEMVKPNVREGKDLDSSTMSGQLLVRFDDTNPEKEDSVYEKAILEDLRLLNITDYKLVRSSDHFDKIYELATRLIKIDKAYCDNTEVEKMREERMDGIASKCRDQSEEENLRIFYEMNNGRSTEYCLRAKIDFQNVNKALRDPVIYRYVNKEHYITGKKYKIYPTYDFACPIVDSLDGVTLTLRTNEYRDRNAQYYWFIDTLGLENRPKIHDFSRLNFENTVLSKRQIKFYVDHKLVEGWDDPRLCTLRGIKRQGMDMEALCEYILMQGSSQKSSTISWDKIWALNKKKIDPISPRYSAVQSIDCVECQIFENGGTNMNIGVNELLISQLDRCMLIGESIRNIPLHKKNLDLGTKEIFLSNLVLISQEDAQILEVNEEFTLMNWGNAIVKEKIEEKGIVKTMKFLLNLNGDYKTTKNKITWISKKGSSFVKFYEYGNLQNESASEDLVEKFNKESKKEEWWIAEGAISKTKVNDFVQIERIGFFRCDKSMEFNLIPFTKQKRKI